MLRMALMAGLPFAMLVDGPETRSSMEDARFHFFTFSIFQLFTMHATRLER
jgi:hypothetical protein